MAEDNAGAGNAGAGNAGAGNAGAGNAGAGNAATPPWHGLTDPADIAYVDNKGWKATPDVVKGYRGAEGLLGRDPNTLLVIPKADDPVGFRAAMSKLGLPETPDKYEFDSPKDMKLDDSYLAWAKQTFHKVGLPASVAKSLTAEHNAYIKGVLDKQAKDYELNVTTDKAALQKEWGGGYERMAAAATTAAKSLGFTGDMIDAMEKSVGYAGTMKFFAQLGQKLGEDGFVRGGVAPFSGQLTPEEAKSEWTKMQQDPVTLAALKDKFNPGNKEAAAKARKLFQIMYPETK